MLCPLLVLFVSKVKLKYSQISGKHNAILRCDNISGFVEWSNVGFVQSTVWFDGLSILFIDTSVFSTKYTGKCDKFSQGTFRQWFQYRV